jgi:hypothetical protein
MFRFSNTRTLHFSGGRQMHQAKAADETPADSGPLQALAMRRDASRNHLLICRSVQS